MELWILASNSEIHRSVSPLLEYSKSKKYDYLAEREKSITILKNYFLNKGFDIKIYPEHAKKTTKSNDKSITTFRNYDTF